ncbi:hypothetical protein [Streptomyces sp. NPDC008150]|uniref:hypothetical protein n=1 Tax=Streptomyces sp. NPDC008150 TaxID=3364816 RepID=UPI0036E4D1F6
MPESVPVRCPDCRRTHRYTAPSYPCACGSPVAPALHRDLPATPVTRPAWEEQWIVVRCGACGRGHQWPRPELGCPCGTVLRVALVPAPEKGGTGAADDRPAEPRPAGGGAAGDRPPEDAGARPAEYLAARLPAVAPVRPAFRSVPVRTARDMITATALYLRWLGLRDVRRAEERPAPGVALTAGDLLAQVDPSIGPAPLRDVECVWLTALARSARCAYFSLAGYTDDARSRADSLGVPLYVLDPAGAPQPVNGAAEELHTTQA